MSIRSGDRLAEMGQPDQVCGFTSSDMYFNPGPARIPAHHITVQMCRDLGVGVEPFINRNFSAYLHARDCGFPGNKSTVRDLEFDIRGHCYEILHRAIDSGEIQTDLTAQDMRHLAAYLKGMLEENSGKYRGRGLRTPGENPYTIDALLRSGMLWKLGFFDEFDLQATMLQITGGVDRLTTALAAQLKSNIKLLSPVRRFTASNETVEVAVESNDGRVSTLRCDQCIVAIPLTVLAGVGNNLGVDFNRQTTGARYETAVKVGLESNSRWWETEMGLYGGMTFTDETSTQFWYPSHGFDQPNGVFLGAYNFGDAGRTFSDFTPKQRVHESSRQVSSVHGRTFSPASGISVAWSNNQWARGAYATKNFANSAALARPHHRIRLAGEHMSDKHGWLAGAIESGHSAADWVLGAL